jgi:hypothetical protein
MSSHGVPAISAARIVGDHSISRPAAICSFQRSTNTLRFRNAIGFLPLGVDADVEPARPDPHGGIIRSGVRRAKLEARA